MLNTFLSRGESLHLKNDLGEVLFQRYYGEDGSLTVVSDKDDYINNVNDLSSIIRELDIEDNITTITITLTCGEKQMFKIKYK